MAPFSTWMVNMALSLDFHRANVTTVKPSEKGISVCEIKTKMLQIVTTGRPLHLLWFPIITAELVPAVVLKHPNSVPDINNDVTEEWRNGKQSTVLREEKWYPDQYFIASRAALPNFCSYSWGKTQFPNFLTYSATHFTKGDFPASICLPKPRSTGYQSAAARWQGPGRASSSTTQPTAPDNSQVTVCHKRVCVRPHCDPKRTKCPHVGQSVSVWILVCNDLHDTWIDVWTFTMKPCFHNAAKVHKKEWKRRGQTSYCSCRSLLWVWGSYTVFSISCSLIVLYSHFSRLKKELLERPV